jgi:hypothetical protein
MPWRGHDPRDPGVASEASARVGEVLARAEAWAREIRERAERSASETRRTARHEAEGIAAEARRAVEAAAVERVHQISALRASIAARAGSLVEGLEGGELTAARLDELVAALGEAEVRILREVGGTVEPAQTGRREAAARGGDRDVIAWPARPGERPAGAGPAAAGPPAARPATATAQDGAVDPEPSAPAAHDATAAPPAVERAVEPSPRGAPEPIADPLPEGAPIARRPKRASSARFAAVMMAIQGCDRAEVEAHLAREHGLEDAGQLLDDVFGRADATA